MDQPEDFTASSEKPDQETTELLDIAQMVTAHLESCSDCHPPFKPVAMGQEAGFCAAYWEMVKSWADQEGRLNNVVSHDEYGNEAKSFAENPGYWWRHGAP
jgi:hypothetical protein